MTREDALKMLHGMKADNLNLEDAYIKDRYEALVMAIEALEHESCEDAISRQAVKELFQEACEMKMYDFLGIDDLLPVTPQPKTGHWIPVSERLPEENGRYLVTIGGLYIGGLYNYLYVETASYAKDLHKVDEYDFESGIGDGWYDYASEYGHYEIDTVIAWMPLPEHYKVESEK